MVTKPLVVISGIGQGLGLSQASAFAEKGYDVCGIAKSTDIRDMAHSTVARHGSAYAHLTCDATNADALQRAISALSSPIAVAIHNIAGLVIKPFAETSVGDFENAWRLACLAGFNLSKAVLPLMATAGRGTLIFTGATAARRGSAGFSAFASARFAERGLAEALAREYGPKGIHVAHVVLDGLIDELQTNARFGPATGTRMSPDAIASTYVMLAMQPPSAQTFELDLHPMTEKF